MQRVLVIYASKHGSTREIAEAIADELGQAGLEAEAIGARDVEALDCDAVILGSAVHMGRWRREAGPILRTFGETLEEMPFWVFSSGPVGDPASEDDDAERWIEPQHTVAEALRLNARDHAVFRGSIAEPARDWEQIRSWARGIALELGATTAT